MKARKFLSLLFFITGIFFVAQIAISIFIDDGKITEKAILKNFSCDYGLHDSYTIVYSDVADPSHEKMYSGYGHSCNKFSGLAGLLGSELTLVFDEDRRYLKEFRVKNEVIFSENEVYWSGIQGFILLWVTSWCLGFIFLKAKSW